MYQAHTPPQPAESLGIARIYMNGWSETLISFQQITFADTFSML